jgi:hypothetical protein
MTMKKQLPTDRQHRMEDQDWELDFDKKGAVRFKDQDMRRDGRIKYFEGMLIVTFYNGEKNNGVSGDDLIAIARDFFNLIIYKNVEEIVSFSSTSPKENCLPTSDPLKKGVLTAIDGDLKNGLWAHVYGSTLTCVFENNSGDGRSVCTAGDLLLIARDIYLSFPSLDIHTQLMLKFLNNLIAWMVDTLEECKTKKMFRKEIMMNITDRLEQCLITMDKRAFDRHGYSGDKEEADFIPSYKKEEDTK